jgi:hypothetical protein
MYRSFRRRGLAGTFVHALRRPFQESQPEWTRPDTEAMDDAAFDRQYGVETAGIVKLKNLKVESPNWVYGIDYEPVPTELFRRAMAGLDIGFSAFSFVDLGSGKGKALLLAAAYPFKEVIGVEIADDLNTTAEHNISRYTGPRRASSVSSVCIDALSFELPSGPLVIHAYNPFDGEVMTGVIERILARASREPSPIYVVLCYPRLEHLFIRREFETVSRGQGYAVFKARSSLEA